MFSRAICRRVGGGPDCPAAVCGRIDITAQLSDEGGRQPHREATIDRRTPDLSLANINAGRDPYCPYRLCCLDRYVLGAASPVAVVALGLGE
jgi:hypothetical protein